MATAASGDVLMTNICAGADMCKGSGVGHCFGEWKKPGRACLDVKDNGHQYRKGTRLIFRIIRFVLSKRGLEWYPKSAADPRLDGVWTLTHLLGPPSHEQNHLVLHVSVLSCGLGQVCSCTWLLWPQKGMAHCNAFSTLRILRRHAYMVIVRGPRGGNSFLELEGGAWKAKVATPFSSHEEWPLSAMWIC